MTVTKTIEDPKTKIESYKRMKCESNCK